MSGTSIMQLLKKGSIVYSWPQFRSLFCWYRNWSNENGTVLLKH